MNGGELNPLGSSARNPIGFGFVDESAALFKCTKLDSSGSEPPARIRVVYPGSAAPTQKIRKECHG